MPQRDPFVAQSKLLLATSRNASGSARSRRGASGRAAAGLQSREVSANFAERALDGVKGIDARNANADASGSANRGGASRSGFTARGNGATRSRNVAILSKTRGRDHERSNGEKKGTTLHLKKLLYRDC